MASRSILVEVAHVRGPGKLRFREGAIVYEPTEGEPTRIATQKLTRLVCHGPVEATSAAMEECARMGIDLAWLSLGASRCRMRLEPSNSPTVMVRVRQLAAIGNKSWNLEQARKLVRLKLESIAAALRHGQRHGAEQAGAALASIAPLVEKTALAESVGSMRGLEGAGTALWYSYFGSRVPEPWVFPGRVRRPATDPVNSLLGLAATLLRQRAQALAAAAGLEPALGSLHEFRAGRPSLACDLMEPFRIPMVDRWTLRTFRGGLLNSEDFQRGPEGAVTLVTTAFGRIVASWEAEAKEFELDRELEGLIGETKRSFPPWPDEPSTDSRLGGALASSDCSE